MRIRERNSAIIDLHLQIGKETKSTLPTSDLIHSHRSLQGSMHKIGNWKRWFGDKRSWRFHIVEIFENFSGKYTYCFRNHSWQCSNYQIFFFQRKTSIWYGLQYSTRTDLNTCFLRKVLCLQSFVEWQTLLLLISIANRLLKETTQLQLIRSTSTTFIPT